MATVSLLFTVTLICEVTGMLFGVLFESRVDGSTCFDIFIGTEALGVDEEASADNTSGSTGNTGASIGSTSGSTDNTGASIDSTDNSVVNTDATAADTGVPITSVSLGRIENPEAHIASAAPEFRPYLEYIRDEIPLHASMQYNIYQGESLQVTDYIEENAEYYAYYNYDPLMAYSDYAALRKMLGYSEATLEPGHYIIHCMVYLGDLMEGYGQTVSVDGTCLSPGSVYTEYFTQIWDGNGRAFILVVPDECLSSRPVSHKIYGAMTSVPLTQVQDDRLQEIHEKQRGCGAGLRHFTTGHSTLMTKTALTREYAATSACTIFPLYYLALILTMASATILTVQQLSEGMRYRQQFTLLGKLGMDHLEMARTLRKQFAIYYAMPALPPLLISIPFLWAMGYTFEPGTIEGAGQLAAILGTAFGLFFLIYFVYILMAYSSLKKNVLAE